MDSPLPPCTHANSQRGWRCDDDYTNNSIRGGRQSARPIILVATNETKLADPVVLPQNYVNRCRAERTKVTGNQTLRPTQPTHWLPKGVCANSIRFNALTPIAPERTPIPSSRKKMKNAKRPPSPSPVQTINSNRRLQLQYRPKQNAQHTISSSS